MKTNLNLFSSIFKTQESDNQSIVLWFFDKLIFFFYTYCCSLFLFGQFLIVPETRNIFFTYSVMIFRIFRDLILKFMEWHVGNGIYEK